MKIICPLKDKVQDTTFECPLCGREVDKFPSVVVLDCANVIIVDGKTITLRPITATIARMLSDAMPGVVSLNKIIEKLYNFGMNEPETAENTTAVHINYLRKSLSGTPIKIKNYYGKGYAMKIEGKYQVRRERSDEI